MVGNRDSGSGILTDRLEDRLARIEARAEIQDLAARYFLATDDDDWNVLAECFAPDGSFEAAGFGKVEGRDQVIALLKQSRAMMGQTVHCMDYPLVELTGPDTATGVVTAHLELGMGEETVFGAVRYIDSYVRIEGRWTIASRIMRAVHMGSWDQVRSSLVTRENVRWPGAEPQSSECPRPSSAIQE